MITVTLPLRIVSVPNQREHWAVKARRTKAHRHAALAVPKAGVPCTVKLTRIGLKLLDGDNLQAGLKALRDGIADRLGVDDADPRVVWEYAQERGEYAVRVEITPWTKDAFPR